MDKTLVLYITDATLGIAFLLTGITGIMKMPGWLPAIGISYTSLPFRTISTVHDWAGIAMVVMVALHLLLHWRWIVLMTKRHVLRREPAQPPVQQ